LYIDHKGSRLSLTGETNRKKLGLGVPVSLTVMKLKSQRYVTWYFSPENEIRIDDVCLDYPPGAAGANKDTADKVLAYQCHGGKGNQQFIYKARTAFECFYLVIFILQYGR
jgi:hypothetical protein